jgi:hypothetical protein
VSAAALMDGLIARGVRFAIDAEGLLVRAPVGVVTDAERTALTVHKAELIALLTPPRPTHEGPSAETLDELLELARQSGGSWTDPDCLDIDFDVDISDYIVPE